jgi:N-acetylmuramoyl-L-alanine amidase
MKKWISLLSVAILILFANIGGANAAAKPATAIPKLYLDGKILPANVPPTLVHSSMLVPIRTVAENLGYKVSYDVKKKSVTLKQNSTLILMTVSSKKAAVNGKSVVMNEAPVIMMGTTLIPIKFVGQMLNLQILWDNASKSAFLYTPSNADSGKDSGNVPTPGTNTGSTGTDTQSADGGVIGVVDGSDGTGTDGGTPAATQATLHQIRYETDAVVLGYDGVTVPKTNVLTGPDRIVVDLPNTEFAADLTADNSPVFANGLPAVGQIADLAVSGHEALQQIRFSQYQDNPKTVRVVLDLNQPWGFEITNDTSNGELRINLKKPVAPEPSKSTFTVVLDAGHGGSDPGARSSSGRWEKDFTLPVVLKMQALLASDSRIKVFLTRSGDTYPSLSDRVNLAESVKADLFLSVHGNSYMSSSVGSETYYTRPESLAFANIIHQYAVPACGFEDKGIHMKSLQVTRETTMPAVLFEAGYLSNPSEEKVMYTEDFQNREAQALVAALKAYLNLN